MDRRRGTRRTFLVATAAAVGATAGCVSGTERESEDNPGGNDTETPGGTEETETESDGATDEETDAETETGTEEPAVPYTVTTEPVGDVTFEEVPETWLTYESDYADMALALGMVDGLEAVGEPHRFHAAYYEELGIDVPEEITPLWNDGIDKELFYELDADVHLVDPNWLEHNAAFGLDGSDVEEIGESVGPFVGNTIFRRSDDWHDYRYYTMYEAFEKVAQVFRREERYESLKAYHDEFIGDVRAGLPPESDRPNALLVWQGADEPEEFYPARLDDEGAATKQFRDLGVSDALAGTGIEGLSTSDRGTIDYEAILEIDPDVFLIRGHESKTGEEFAETVLAYMRDHDVASDLTSVANGRVFRGGPIYQGPLLNFFTTERVATEVYPDRYDGELFDRQRVADIVAGDR